MSRQPGAVSVRHTGIAPGGSSSSTTTNNAPILDDQEETCPVCKTTRYFNRDMEFRINPECYHRMCKTCVERIFRDGPNQCPYAGCHKTLRLRGFKTAFFTDLFVEREVDIRRRVAAVFNKVEDDFVTLEDYNDYLYMVECLTDDMVKGNNEAKAAAEAKLLEWEAQHKAEIERNRHLAREGEESRQKRLHGDQEAARLRRMRDMQSDADEKASAVRFREEMLNSLQTADAGRADEAINRVMLKKRGQQRRDLVLDVAATATAGSGLSIRGLREKKTATTQKEGPYDPFGGLDLLPSRVDISSARLGEYSNPRVDAARTKDDFKVGGYSSEEYVTRALFEAFSGLGVFVEDEKTDRSVSTIGAAQAAVSAGGKMDLDDPF